MSKNSNQSNRPSHGIYQVQGEDKKARWNRVGSAWMHKDKKGANLIFDSIPLSGRVVIREMTEQENAASDNFNAMNGGDQ